MKVKAYIASLLLLCFSVFLGHNLVPHHHHSEVFKSPLTSACPFEHSDHQGHDQDSDSNSDAEEHPTHCHAFNNLVFEKYIAPSYRPWTLSLLAVLVPGQTNLLEKEQLPSSISYAVLKLPCWSAVYLGSRSLRAPPVFA